MQDSNNLSEEEKTNQKWPQKMETANQKWPNLRYKTYSQPSLMAMHSSPPLSPLFMVS
jgi:hypothetical protein